MGEFLTSGFCYLCDMNARKPDFNITAVDMLPQFRIRLSNIGLLPDRSEVSKARYVARVEIEDEGLSGHARKRYRCLCLEQQKWVERKKRPGG